jgi:hypothetical protein
VVFEVSGGHARESTVFAPATSRRDVVTELRRQRLHVPEHPQVRDPVVSLEQVLALLEQVEKVAEKAPARAREVLAGLWSQSSSSRPPRATRSA